MGLFANMQKQFWRINFRNSIQDSVFLPFNRPKKCPKKSLLCFWLFIGVLRCQSSLELFYLQLLMKIILSNHCMFWRWHFSVYMDPLQTFPSIFVAFWGVILVFRLFTVFYCVSLAHVIEEKLLSYWHVCVPLWTNSTVCRLFGRIIMSA